MSIINKLRSWHDIYDAARVISDGLGEPVGPVDVLALAIEQHLTLSAKLVNGAWGRRCCEVTDLARLDMREIPTLDGAGMIQVPLSGHLLTLAGKIFHVDGDVVSLDGIFDLPMIGGERIDVEFTFHQLQFHPEPGHVSLDGVLVRRSDGQLYELQERHEKRADWRDRMGNPANFHPAGALPDDRIFVVRKQFLDDFIATHSKLPDELKSRERSTLLNIIGVLLNALNCKESSLISELLEKHPEVPGIKKRTLEEKFAEAKRALRSN